MKSYYVMIEKESFKFTEKKHYAPSVIYMNEEVYGELLHETYGDVWWVLIHSRRIMGLKIIITNDEYSFHLE